MKTINIKLILSAVALVAVASCTHDDAPNVGGDPGVGSSTEELLVAKFAKAPNFDGDIDEMWSKARPLLSAATVSAAGAKTVPLNKSSNGNLSLEPSDLFDPYTGESYKYSLRGGHDGEYLYLLLEYEDEADSKDRESFYFDPASKTWQQENKYANHKNDKYYEDKFGFMFPIKVNGQEPAGFKAGTCTVTCHGGLTGTAAGSKSTRHYMKNAGELADLWHWKRNRNELSKSVDDGYVTTDAKAGTADANGRKSDAGIKMYDDSPVFTDAVTGKKGPKWVKKGQSNYYWITTAELTSGAAQTVTGVSVDGVLKLSDGSTIDPNTDLVAYSKGFGKKRFPSVTVNAGGAGADGRSDTQVRAKHTGSGWQIEIKRKLNSGDPFDAIFVPGEEMSFGMAIFNNSAIAHGMSNFKTMKIVK
ncbi:ethylbenzene dehydrogenase-related protein [Lutibacter sp.]|uniref:ethylbenzene dehydrogenase-related protein n=1 Tax=Lutibacter sp. TaxID=1925666 RepID=UPI002734D320|nr:ethylbenzene dehydrogenase-related protein [Lutibacter sp.]MDP3312402.1 ethylbenzene dehydrogenase-related protein [Lutibacter sp.]